MTTLGGYKVHEAAEKFPLIEGDEFEELIASIEEHGLRDPIVLSDDIPAVLLDGRNRFRACKRAGVEPQFRTHRGNQIDFIRDVNIWRRHLSKSQISFALGELSILQEEENERKAKAAMAAGGRVGGRSSGARKGGVQNTPPLSPPKADRKTTAIIARKAGVSPRSVAQARRVAKQAPEPVKQQVRAGKVSVGAADRQIRQQTRPKTIPRNPDPDVSEKEALTVCEKAITQIEAQLRNTQNNDPWQAMSIKDLKELTVRWRRAKGLFDKHIERITP